MGFFTGLAAGAAGTTALNAVTYLDMAVRGRPASSTPQQLVEKAADQAGVDIPGHGDVRDNRLEGLGPLSGTLVGVSVGAASGLLHRAFRRSRRHVPAVVEAVLIGAVAMVLSDVPLKLLGVSDPGTWAAKDWVSDAVPHLVYGIVTTATLHATES